VSFWKGIKWYVELCGVRGALAIASFRLFKRPTEVRVLPFERTAPIYLRIDTSDFCSYRDVLIFKTKCYTAEIPEFAPRTIVDAGAHIGMSSILFARTYPNAKIVALEPEASNYAALLRNTKPYKNVICIRAALWRHDGEVALGKSDAHPKGAFEIVENGCEKVRAMTIPSVMQAAGITSIDLLKMDIEGAEKEVFQCCPWAVSVRVFAIELHDRVRPGCSEAVHSAMRDRQSVKKGDILFFMTKSDDPSPLYLRDLPGAISGCPPSPESSVA
jgi:FkbM family methyltransferase